MRWFGGLLFALVPLIATTNCATVFSSSTYEYNFESEPADATVTIFSRGNEISRLQTPGAYELDLDSDYYFRFELDGYETHTIRLQKDVDLWIIGNLVFFSYIGLAIDALTGAIHKPATTTIKWSFRKPISTAHGRLHPDQSPAILEIRISSPNERPIVRQIVLCNGSGERFHNLHELAPVPL